MEKKFPWLRELPFSKKVEWLSQYEKQKGINFPCLLELLEAVEKVKKPQEAVLLLEKIKRWKENMDGATCGS